MNSGINASKHNTSGQAGFSTIDPDHESSVSASCLKGWSNRDRPAFGFQSSLESAGIGFDRRPVTGPEVRWESPISDVHNVLRFGTLDVAMLDRRKLPERSNSELSRP